MSEQVLSDEQVAVLCDDAIGIDKYADSRKFVREIESLVVAALAARSGVDVEAAVESIPQCMDGSHDAFGTRDCSECGTGIADALRLALAQQEARHAEREAMWRELDRVCRDNGSVVRERELRRALGLNG